MFILYTQWFLSWRYLRIHHFLWSYRQIRHCSLRTNGATHWLSHMPSRHTQG